jgi:hypothetical protein
MGWPARLAGHPAGSLHNVSTTVSGRGDRILGLAGLVAAGAVPAWIFRDLLAHLANSFQPNVDWLLTGAIGFALMGGGLLASVPVVLSIGRTPDHPLYPRSRGSLAGWGVSLYLLGAMLVVQIGAIAHNW